MASGSIKTPSDILCLYAARALRGFGDGFAIIILPVYLRPSASARNTSASSPAPRCWGPPPSLCSPASSRRGSSCAACFSPAPG